MPVAFMLVMTMSERLVRNHARRHGPFDQYQNGNKLPLELQPARIMLRRSKNSG